MTQQMNKLKQLGAGLSPGRLVRIGLYLILGACFITGYAQDFDAPAFGQDALAGDGDDLKLVACDWLWIGVAIIWAVIFSICAFVPVKRLLVSSGERGGGAGDAMVWSAVVVFVALITSALMYYAYGIAQTWCGQ